MKNQKTTVILGIVYSVLCVYVLVAELCSVIPALQMMTGQMLLTHFFVPLLWAVAMILMTIWVAKGKDNGARFIAVLLITHIIDFAMKIPNIILSPKDYAFTILIFITAVAGMVCGLCFRSKKIIYLILLGVSYVVLVGMNVMRMKSAIAQMYSQVFSPVSVVIVNIIKPIALLAAICVFAYYIFVRDEC